MKNITVSVDDHTHEMARIRAAELDTSVSALVREYLRSLTRGSDQRSPSRGQAADVDLESRRRLLQETFKDFDARGIGLRMSDNLSREELHDRDRARADAAIERQHSFLDQEVGELRWGGVEVRIHMQAAGFDFSAAELGQLEGVGGSFSDNRRDHAPRQSPRVVEDCAF